MKQILTFIAIVLSLKTFAQDNEQINFNKINREQRNIIAKKNDYDQKTKFEKFFIADFDKHTISKRRKLSTAEKKSIPLLKCLTQLKDKKKGGYKSPLIIHSILTSAMEHGQLSTKKKILEKALVSCEEAQEKLLPFKVRLDEHLIAAELSMLPQSTEEELKALDFVGYLFLGTPVCQLDGIRVGAGAMVGVNVGLIKTKCVMPDGKVRNYLGGLLGVNWILGAEVDYIRSSDLNSETIALGSAVKAARLRTDHYSSGGLIGFGNTSRESTASQSVGLSLRLGDLGDGVIAGRFINGFRRWDLLLDILQ